MKLVFISCIVLLLVANSYSTNQLFEEIDREIKLSNQKEKAIAASDDVVPPSLFLQMNEKKTTTGATTGTIKSLFEETKAKVEENNKNKEKEDKPTVNQKDEKEDQIALLEKKINRLMKQTDKLTSKIRTINKEDDQIVSFLEKQDHHVDKITSKVAEKEQTITAMSNKNAQSILFLGEKIKELESKINNLKKQIVAKDITSDNALIGNLVVDGEYLKVSPKTIIEIGNRKISGSDLSDTISFVRMAKERCGGDFKNCKIMNQKDFSEEKKNEMEILNNIRRMNKHSRKGLENELNGSH